MSDLINLVAARNEKILEQEIEIQSLKKEIAELKEDLKRERDCVDYYADKDIWFDSVLGGCSEEFTEVCDYDWETLKRVDNSKYIVGGKRARETQKLRRDKSESC